MRPRGRGATTLPSPPCGGGEPAEQGGRGTRGLAARLRADESGAAILEFALVLPLLLALLFGGFEVGRALLARQALDGAVRLGARLLARAPDPTCTPGDPPACPPGAARAVRATAAQIAANTGLPPGAIRVAPVPDAAPGTVAMEARLAFPLLIPGAAGRLAAWTLSARHQEARVAD